MWNVAVSFSEIERWGGHSWETAGCTEEAARGGDIAACRPRKPYPDFEGRTRLPNTSPWTGNWVFHNDQVVYSPEKNPKMWLLFLLVSDINTCTIDTSQVWACTDLMYAQIYF